MLLHVHPLQDASRAVGRGLVPFVVALPFAEENALLHVDGNDDRLVFSRRDCAFAQDRDFFPEVHIVMDAGRHVLHFPFHALHDFLRHDPVPERPSDETRHRNAAPDGKVGVRHFAHGRFGNGPGHRRRSDHGPETRERRGPDPGIGQKRDFRQKRAGPQRENRQEMKPMNSEFFQISDLTCVRGGKTILSGVGFTLRKGEFAALLGQNGAGKSTLLKCIMRLLPAETSFRATLEGRDLAELSARELAQKIVYVPQVQTQNFPFTVREFIEAARYAHQSPWSVLTSADRALCEKVLTQTGLDEFADRSLSTLSGGELQRVWLAGALAQNGKILLLDEAFSQMDYRNRTEIFALLHQLNCEEEKTILFITHEINEAVQNANRILGLKAGTLIFDGSTAEFLAEDWPEAIFETSFLRIPHPDLPFPAVLPIKQLNETP